MRLISLSKRTLCAVALAGVFAVTGSAYGQGVAKTPEHPVTAEQVKKLMTITHSTDRILEGMHKMIVQQKVSLPFFPDAFWTDFEAEMAKVDWVAVATPIYQKYLSTEDADKAIAFYATDSGQRSLDSSMAVMMEMTAKSSDIGREAGGRLGQKYAAEIEANMKKLQQSAPAGTQK